MGVGDASKNTRETSIASWVRFTHVGGAMRAEGRGRGGDEESTVAGLARSSVIRAPGGRSNRPGHVGKHDRPIER